MKLPRFPSPFKWWGLSLCLAGMTVYFGYPLREVFSGIVHIRLRSLGSSSDLTDTWDASPWGFTIHVAIHIIIAGLCAYLSVMTAIAAFSLRAVAPTERGADNS
jgi:hypothetical protein